MKKKSRSKWRKVLIDDVPGVECCNCGATHDLRTHHIVPLGVGGEDQINNVVVVCNDCHYLIHNSEKIYKARRGGNDHSAKLDGRPPVPHAEGYLTMNECVEKYGRTARTYQTAIANGYIQGYRISGRKLYTTAEEIEKYNVLVAKGKAVRLPLRDIIQNRKAILDMYYNSNTKTLEAIHGEKDYKENEVKNAARD